MKMKDIKKMLFDSINSVGAIMVMIIFCLMLSQTLTMLQVPQALIQIIFGLTRNKTVIERNRLSVTVFYVLLPGCTHQTGRAYIDNRKTCL